MKVFNFDLVAHVLIFVFLSFSFCRRQTKTLRLTSSAKKIKGKLNENFDFRFK